MIQRIVIFKLKDEFCNDAARAQFAEPLFEPGHRQHRDIQPRRNHGAIVQDHGGPAGGCLRGLRDAVTIRPRHRHVSVTRLDGPGVDAQPAHGKAIFVRIRIECAPSLEQCPQADRAAHRAAPSVPDASATMTA